MTQSEFDNRAKEIQEIVVRIDNLTSAFLGGTHKVFGNITLPLIGSTTSEAAFNKLVSYLYVLIYESGKASLDFIIKEYLVVHVNPTLYDNDLRKLVHNFRTFFGHNLDLEKPEDVEKLKYCENWFLSIINRKYPDKIDEWNKPLDLLCTEARKFLMDIEKSIVEIIALETSDLFRKNWSEKAFHSYNVYSFEKICQEVVSYFDLETLDLKNFCKKRFQGWLKELAILSDFDFTVEATKMIERDLIKFCTEESQKMPISGKDLIDSLGILGGGKVIGVLLAECNTFYKNSPCSKEDLLSYARDKYSTM